MNFDEILPGDVLCSSHVYDLIISIDLDETYSVLRMNHVWKLPKPYHIFFPDDILIRKGVILHP